MILVNVLAFWVGTYVLAVAASFLFPDGQGVIDFAVAAFWPWAIVAVVLGATYLARRPGF